MSLQPAPSDLHVDQLLTNISIGYINGMYIAREIFPIVTVMKQSDIVPKYDQSYWFRDAAQIRAPKTASTGGGFEIDTDDTYFCHRYSYRFEVADEQRDNTDSPFNLDRDGALFVSDKIQMAIERKFAADHFTTNVWTTDKTGGSDFTQWDDYANSTPLIDIATYKDTVEGLTAREPNTLTVGKEVWTQLRWHPDVMEFIKGDSAGRAATRQQFAGLVELDKLLVGSAIYTSDAEGTAEGSVTYSRIWGKDALLTYVPATPSLFTPAAGYTFVWGRVPNAYMWVKRMRNEEREVDILEGNTYFDQKVTAARSGLFMSSAVA